MQGHNTDFSLTTYKLTRCAQDTVFGLYMDKNPWISDLYK